MDRDLLRQCLTYHGESLFNTLKCEQTENPDFQAVVADLCKTPYERNGEEQSSPLVEQFIARKADILFSPSWKTATPKEEEEEGGGGGGQEEVAEAYAVMPPLELFMEVPFEERRAMLYRDLEPGDIVMGRINNVREYGFFLTLICTAGGLNRDIEDLELSALCHIKEIPSTGSHDDPLSYYQIGDLIRAGVKDIDRYQEKITVSLMQASISARSDCIQLGVMTREELPVQYERSICAASDTSKTYERILRCCHGYHNPCVVDYLLEKIGVSDVHPPSMMRGLQSKLFEKDDFAAVIRKQQSASWALKCVKVGVDHFKQGRHVEAMNEYNKALDIDTNNVEALVARGALYANKGVIMKAISDFELALETCPDHRNAKKYLCQTLVERGKQLEEQEKLVTAEGVYRRALSLDDANTEAQEALKKIMQTIQNSIRLREEALAKEVEEKAKSSQSSAEKLRKIMKDEKRMKRKRKRSSSSSSSSTSGKSSTSSSSSSRRRAKRKKKKKRKSARESKRHRGGRRKSEEGKRAKKRKEKEDEESECYSPPPDTAATFLHQNPWEAFEEGEVGAGGEPSRKANEGDGLRICLYSLSSSSEEDKCSWPSHRESQRKESRSVSSDREGGKNKSRGNGQQRTTDWPKRNSLDERKRRVSCSSSESAFSRKPFHSKDLSRRNSFRGDDDEMQAENGGTKAKVEASWSRSSPAEVQSEQEEEISLPEGKSKKDLPANLLQIFNQIAKFQKEKGIEPKKGASSM
ncbi:tetratricopeptide repeat protein 14 isoform X1 [Syngnathus scovelli]|uniref:tetratricopeptide repeat protein 14 isoform X1 n=1 Tax=Syngnathus scovelli TaxID=161590 RepID=UPI00210FF709|nr:tetratricopeptide repeat protein 14 isoform X1 [Syngnathus scovelli]